MGDGQSQIGSFQGMGEGTTLQVSTRNRTQRGGGRTMRKKTSLMPKSKGKRVEKLGGDMQI